MNNDKGTMHIELGEDLMNQAGLKQLQPGDTSKTPLKFDAKGSVHVMCRNDDDKLLKDLTVKDVAQHSTTFEEKDDYLKELDEINEQRKKVSVVAYVVFAMLLLLFVGAVAVIKLLLGGL